MASEASEAPDRGGSGRRTFRIQSQFGGARQWRSRKHRPCDACRRRRTACVIATRPPCHFCASRNLPCQFRTDPKRRQTLPESPFGASVCKGDNSMEGAPDPQCSSPGIGTASTAGERETTAQPSEIQGGGLSDADEGIPSRVRQTAVCTPAYSRAEGEASFASHSSGFFSPSWMNSVGVDPSPLEVHSERSDVGQHAFLTLEDGKNLTAHSVGLSGEQDTDLLATFRSDIMNETNRVDMNVIQVFGGNHSLGLPPVHFSLIHDEFPEYDERAKKAASDAIEAHVGDYGDALVRLYFRFVHPVYPIMSKARFLREYAKDRLGISPALRGCVYGLACTYWSFDDSLPLACPFTQVEVFENVHAALQRELDAPNLNNLQACLLVLHEQPAANGTIETPRIWTLTSQAVACAQMIGLHRDPTSWNLAPWEKSLRKKLWWATYMADAWSSVCHGNPPHIHATSFNTTDLELVDLSRDEDVDPSCCHLVRQADRHFSISLAARFLESVRLTKLLGTLLLSSFTNEGYKAISTQQPSREILLLGIRRSLSDWHSLLPQSLTMAFPREDACWHNNGPLQLSYYATKALLFRAMMSPATLAAKADPASSLRRYFQSAIEEFVEFNKFMKEIDLVSLRAFWGRHARTNLVLCGNFLIYLFLCASGHEQVAATYGLLEDFHASLQRLSTAADRNNIGLLRPAALRVDSFFAQAAEMMRRGARSGESLRSPQSA